MVRKYISADDLTRGVQRGEWDDGLGMQCKEHPKGEGKNENSLSRCFYVF